MAFFRFLMVRHGQLILNDSFRRVECSSYLYFYITNLISELWSLYQHGYGGKKKSSILRVSSASYARLGDWFCIVITTCMRGAYDSPSFWPEWIQYWHVFPARAGLHYFKKCEWMDNCRIPPNSHLLHCETFGDWTCASENVWKQKYATQASTSLPPNPKEVTQRQEWRVIKWDCETCPRALDCWEEFGAQGLKPRL